MCTDLEKNCELFIFTMQFSNVTVPYLFTQNSMTNGMDGSFLLGKK